MIGKIPPATTSKTLADTLQALNFSVVSKPGHYYIKLQHGLLSDTFSIGDQVFEPLLRAVVKGYYYQRVSEPLSAVHAGSWHRLAGHPDTSVLIHPSAASALRPAGSRISSPGGWYDAGDYNKYVVNAGITLGTLMAAYEDFSTILDTLHTDIPLGNRGVPDFVTELLVNLNWMFTMQDPSDGAVYHKLTNARFDPMVMPDKAVEPRYVVQKTTAAALDFAAVMAQASRVLTPFSRQLPGLSDKYLHAAIRAWSWAMAHPAIYYEQEKMNQKFLPEILTGEYGDRQVQDEFYWAACELFVTTRRNVYKSFIEKSEEASSSVPTWADPAMLGNYSLLRYAGKLNMEAYLSIVRNNLIGLAKKWVEGQEQNPFRVVMGGSLTDFVWGSNSIAANQGMLLLNAYRLTKDHRYFEAANGNLDYLLGRNATGFCFVTGFGTRSPMHPHHRISIADGIIPPVPGLLVGGPNPGQQDHQRYPFSDPSKSYVDNDQAYASNEVAINWNAPLAYLLAGIICSENDIAK